MFPWMGQVTGRFASNLHYKCIPTQFCWVFKDITMHNLELRRGVLLLPLCNHWFQIVYTNHIDFRMWESYLLVGMINILKGFVLLLFMCVHMCVWMPHIFFIPMEARRTSVPRVPGTCKTPGVVLASAAHILKFGTIERRLAWPLHKDDMQIHEAFHIFFYIQLRANIQCTQRTQEVRLQRVK